MTEGLISFVEDEIRGAVDHRIPYEIYMSALANQLTRECIKNNISKKNFIKKLSDGYDHHYKKE